MSRILRSWSNLDAPASGTRMIRRLVLLAFLALPLWAADPPIVDYAKQCFERLGLKPGMVPEEFSCKTAAPQATLYHLFTSVDGVIQDIEGKDGNKNPDAKKIPPLCDRPAWLELGSTSGGCYGNSYLQVINFKEDVKAALLCRHKKKWSDTDRFPDVAMIVHNNKNGETCWFQTDDSDGHEVDGKKVPSPLTDKADKFWMSPTETAAVQCVRCHDNGPWMNSRWINDNLLGLKGKGTPGDPLKPNDYTSFEHPLEDDHGPYTSHGPGFDKWNPPVYVTVARSGLAGKEDKTCTACHHIASAGVTSDGKNEYRNCSKLKSWIAYTTGTEYAPNTNAAGMDFSIANWMPADHIEQGVDTLKAWTAKYQAHINEIVACCTAKGFSNNCEAAKSSGNPHPSLTPGARLAGVIDSGVRYESAIPSHGNEIRVNTDTTLTLSWSADKTFNGCTIEATFPDGVRTFPSGSARGIGTASNWQLEDSPREIGKLTAPGLYRFDMYCGRDKSTSLSFNAVPPPPPPPPPGEVDCHGVTLSPTEATFGPAGGSGAFGVTFPDPTKCSIRAVSVPAPLGGWISPGNGGAACIAAPNKECVMYTVAPLNPPAPPNFPPPPPNPPRTGFIEVVLKDFTLLTFRVSQQ